MSAEQPPGTYGWRGVGTAARGQTGELSEMDAADRALKRVELGVVAEKAAIAAARARTDARALPTATVQFGRNATAVDGRVAWCARDEKKDKEQQQQAAARQRAAWAVAAVLEKGKRRVAAAAARAARPTTESGASFRWVR